MIVGRWSLLVGRWLLVVGLLVIGRWSLVVARLSLVFGRWSLVIGLCLLVVGCWFLVVGHFLFVVGRWWLVVDGLSLVAGRWLLVCWSLVVGRWSMVVGCWSIVNGHGHGQNCLESLSVHSLCQNSKVAVSDSLTKVRYRAARAAKKEIQIEVVLLNLIQSGPSEHKIWDIVQPSCHRLNSPASDSSCG